MTIGVGNSHKCWPRSAAAMPSAATETGLSPSGPGFNIWRKLYERQIWEIRKLAMVIQQKTERLVQFEITLDISVSLLAWLERRGGTIDDFAFPSRIDHTDHLNTCQYARLVDEWLTAIGLRREEYGTNSLRRTKACWLTTVTRSKGLLLRG